MRTRAEQKRVERDRMRRLGLVLKQLWVLPEHWPKIIRYVERLMK